MKADNNYIKLSAYEIDLSEENLFDDCYGREKRTSDKVIKEIKDLKNDNQRNFLKIGRNLLELIDNEMSAKIFNMWLKNEKIKIKRTQAIKYIETYNYCNKKYKKGVTNEHYIELGIEKLYLITKLKNSDIQEKLEKFALEKNLSVKKLYNIIEILNGNNEELQLIKEFNEKYN